MPFKPTRVPPAIHAHEEDDIEMANIQQYLSVNPTVCSSDSNTMLDHIDCH
jgi:hypothetical protein